MEKYISFTITFFITLDSTHHLFVTSVNSNSHRSEFIAAGLANAFVDIMCSGQSNLSCLTSIDPWIKMTQTNFPVLLSPQKQIYLKNDNSNVSINDDLTLLCPGDGNTFEVGVPKGQANNRLKELSCICGNIFHGDNDLHNITDFRCKYRPIADITRVKRSIKLRQLSYDRKKHFEKSTFVDIYDYGGSFSGIKPTTLGKLSCFYIGSPVYSTHFVASPLKENVKVFNDSFVYDYRFNMSQCIPRQNYTYHYNLYSLKESFDLQLSRSQKYLTASWIDTLAPIELMPWFYMSDMLGVVATDVCHNVAPQWRTISIGNWKVTQHYVHDYLKKNNQNLRIVVVGTHGKLKLKNARDEEIPVYLHARMGREHILHVEGQIPLYFLIILFDADKANVFITMNNPYFKGTVDKTLCRYPQQTYVPWDKSNSVGHSYWCAVPDFLQKSEYPFWEVENLLKYESLLSMYSYD